MDGEVEPHEFGEHWVLVPDHFCEVVGPILLWVDGAGGGSLLEEVVVDGGGHHRQLGNQVHRVFVGGLPVLGLVDAVSVGLQCKNGSYRKLRTHKTIRGDEKHAK